MPDQGNIHADFQTLVYAAAVAEIRKIGLTIEHDRLGFGILDFGVVNDREHDRIIGFPALHQYRLLQWRQAVNMQERVLVA